MDKEQTETQTNQIETFIEKSPDHGTTNLPMNIVQFQPTNPWIIIVNKTFNHPKEKYPDSVSCGTKDSLFGWNVTTATVRSDLSQVYKWNQNQKSK